MCAQWAAVFVNVVLGVPTIVLLWWYANETRRIRRAEQLANQPFLSCHFKEQVEETMEIAPTVRRRTGILLRNFGRGLATEVEVRILNLRERGRSAVRRRTAISPPPYGRTEILGDWTLGDLDGCTVRITCKDQGGQLLTFWQRGDSGLHECFEHADPPAELIQRAIEALE